MNTEQPQNPGTRGSEESPLKTPHKIVHESLNAAMNTEYGDLSPESFKDLSLVSEISSKEGKIHKSVSTSLETSLDTDVTPFSKLITCITEPVDDSQIVDKSLSAAINTEYEDLSAETFKDSTDSSKFSEISSKDGKIHRSVSALSETSLDTDVTPSSNLSYGQVVKKNPNAAINTEYEDLSPETFRDLSPETFRDLPPETFKDLLLSEISSKDGKIHRSVSALSETSLDTDVTPSSTLISCITEPVDASEIAKKSPNAAINTKYEDLSPEIFKDLLLSEIHLLLDEVDGLQKFSFETLKNFCFDFGFVLGTGTSGSVYKGTNEGQEMAVKQITKEKTGMEFFTELFYLSRANHDNIVKLIGYCLDEHNKLLVYEIMNGTLTQGIFGGFNRPMRLLWRDRLQIACQIANALDYIHNRMRPTVTHGDLIPENILFSNTGVAKLGDFAYAKRISDPIDLKRDIIRYGYLLMEIFTGKPAWQWLNGKLADVFEETKNFIDCELYGWAVDDILFIHGGPTDNEIKEVFDLAKKCHQFELTSSILVASCIQHIAETFDASHG